MTERGLKIGSGLRNSKFDIHQAFPRLQRLGEKLKNLVKKDSNSTEKALEQAHGYYICRFLGFYHTDPESPPHHGNIIVSDDCLAFHPKEECFKLIIPFDQIVCISISDHLGIKSALQLYKTDGSLLLFSKIIDQKKAFEMLYNGWRSNQNPGFENEVGTTSSTATTDTVSFNQATIPGTSNARKEPADCDCGEHKGTVFVDKIYSLDVDELYQLLFTENESLLNFLKTAKRSDLRYESWTAIEHGERRKKKRTARYTVELSSTLGPKCTHVTEVQVVAEVGPNAIDGYTVTKDAVNAGVPYADSFSVFCTYCITRVESKKSRLKVHGEILYRKSVMGVFKSIIERMTFSGMHDYYKHLDKYLSSCGSKDETSRNGAGSDWISEFPESEMDTQLELESLQGQDPPIGEIRLRAELIKQTNEIRAQAASLRELQSSLRLVVLFLLLIFVVCLCNTYRYSQLDFTSIASGQSFTKPEL